MSEVTCHVCFRHCQMKEGQLGFCGARACKGGQSACVNYGRVTSIALDPVEKKPLARFMPGKTVLSVGSYGCNMNCPFCQNDSISRACADDVPWRYIPPDELAALAKARKPFGNIGAAFTYNEPMIGYEYVRDAAAAVKAQGMANVVVTNGAFSQEVLEEVLPYIDAFNIDLKCFTAEGYRKLGGDLDMVLAFIKTAAKSAHVELTTLIVPGLNDNEGEIRELAAWVASVDRSIPLHITRFFPRSRYSDRQPTPIRTLYRLADVARKVLDTVILGNI
ncbi:MAG TPA: AmmeMemoRadiSam system radical SAM enzyme [Clostridiales bacterium]|nr:AmmeMemoRadiSam system radical SAM enzyme [Clostridiales bacterium]